MPIRGGARPEGKGKDVGWHVLAPKGTIQPPQQGIAAEHDGDLCAASGLAGGMAGEDIPEDELRRPAAKLNGRRAGQSLNSSMASTLLG